MKRRTQKYCTWGATAIGAITRIAETTITMTGMIMGTQINPQLIKAEKKNERHKFNQF